MTAISCLSLVSPVGYSPASAVAAMRAGIAAFGELPYRDANGEAILGAVVNAFAPDLRGRDRLSALVEFAIDQLDPDATEALPWGQMPLILCTREPEMPGGRINGILGGITLPHGAPLAGPKSGHIAAGPISAFAAISRARDLLQNRDVPACIVLAVDSLIDARTLGWLDARARLKTTIETDGLIPGEGACITVVSRQPITQSHVIVRGLGLGRETATIYNEEPLRANGLTAALKIALEEAGVHMHDVAFRLSDVAGESYAFEELVLAQMRTMRKTRPEQPVWHAADCIGDSGAAAGLIQFAWAEQAYKRNYAPGAIAALHGSSSFGGRAAAIVTA
ncbi:hypothetical protein NKI56_21820 [Mesorhizobium sp. M0622]|uniref:hypothetical protein n=1 Tax=unclassified Mesorhizobium TaxID=325217 RepID=UPI00333929B6